MFRITPEPLDPLELMQAVGDGAAGAVALFAGVVRNENLGRRVQYLEYDAYPPMAERKMAELAEEVRAKWPVTGIAMAHRTGRLEIGEASVIIAVSSPHRADAIEACHYAIDQLKATIPIWKKEVFEGGEEWLEGTPIEKAVGSRQSAVGEGDSKTVTPSTPPDPDSRLPTPDCPAVEGFHGDTAAPPPPRFCPMCGGALESRFHPPDGCHRLICTGCDRIQYRNPSVVGAVIPERDGAVLLLRRARPPRSGTWVFPGGYVELGETVEAAAIRECREEVGVEPRLGPLLSVYNRPAPGVVIVVYRATLTDGEPRPGPEAGAVAWFTPDRIPWHELAFDTTEAALRDWISRRITL